MESINDCLLGLYEKALPADLSWDERMRIAKDSGYDFLEISIDETDERMRRVQWNKSERNELLEAIRKHDMPVLTMCLSGNRKYPIGSENVETRRRGIQLIQDAVDFSVVFGVRIIQLAGYDEYYNEVNEKTKSLFVSALKDVTDYAAARGITLAFETMETEMMDSIEKIMNFVKEVNSPYLQIYPDVGNITATSKDVEKDFASGDGHIVAIHLKDTMPNVVRDVPYGEGTVNFISFFRLLKKTGFKGLLVAEMWANDNREASIEYIETARTFLLGEYNKAMQSMQAMQL